MTKVEENRSNIKSHLQNETLTVRTRHKKEHWAVCATKFANMWERQPLNHRWPYAKGYSCLSIMPSIGKGDNTLNYLIQLRMQPALQCIMYVLIFQAGKPSAFCLKRKSVKLATLFVTNLQSALKPYFVLSSNGSLEPIYFLTEQLKENKIMRDTEFQVLNWTEYSRTLICNSLGWCLQKTTEMCWVTTGHPPVNCVRPADLHHRHG